MAQGSKSNKAPIANQAGATEEVFDWSKYLPTGIKVDESTEDGSLTPIYAGEEALTNGWPPLIGRVDRIEVLPAVKKGAEVYTPHMIRMVLLAPTKAMGGTGDSKQEVDMKIGDDILLPISGSIKTKRKLLLAAINEKLVFTALIRVRGKLDTGAQSEMNDFEVRLLNNAETRAGRYLLPTSGGNQLPAGVIAGQVVDENGKEKALFDKATPATTQANAS